MRPARAHRIAVDVSREAAPLVGVAQRVAYLDNLKVLLVAGVIFGHGWAGYDQLGGWTYTDVREVSIAPGTETVLEVLLGPFGLFAMGFFFLMAGLLTPGSVSRKGPGRFARDRLVRLGIPLVVFTFVLWPPWVALMDRATGRPARYVPDTAHLWFLEVLLIFSLGYAAWRRPRPEPLPGNRSALTLRRLLVLAVVVAVASFLVRVRFPLDSTQWGDLHLWQWPQFLALFGLGLLGRRPGWLDPVSDRLRRACGYAALLSVLAIAGFAGVVALAGVPAQDFLGGWHWASAGTAGAEGLLAVMVSVWLLGLAQQRLVRPFGSGGPARSAYAAFIVQGYVLVGLALLIRPVPVPAEVKGLVVSVFGLLGSYALGWLLATRTALGRLL